jgi:cytochrome c biogenesis protein CcdA
MARRLRPGAVWGTAQWLDRCGNNRHVPFFDTAALSLLATALVLGLRHGLDWDHIAAISDITSTTGAAEAAEREHALEHGRPEGHHHPHGGAAELETHAAAVGRAPLPAVSSATQHSASVVVTVRQPVLLGTLYALGHALVVAILGVAALVIGARLPEWLDPLMGRIVGLTLLLLGIWVFVSLYHYVRHGTAFRLRSRWMLLFDGVRYAWRRFQAWLHGHEHVEPLEMSSYGPRTAFGVGMIHGIGAETGTQVLLIAAIGGATEAGLGIPMMLAFIAGLLITNTLIVLVSASGFMASHARRQAYVVVGVLAGTFSLLVGGAFLLGLEDLLPALT